MHENDAPDCLFVLRYKHTIQWVIRWWIRGKEEREKVNTLFVFMNASK